MLTELGHQPAVPPYSTFMRADLDALTEFHRTGRAPIWRDFFARWRHAHRHDADPYHPKPVPAFTPTPVEVQEILQRQG